MKLLIGLMTVSLVAAPVITKKEAEAQASISALDANPISKVVQVSEKDIVDVSTRLRFSTLIVLPATENILDFVCGDKEFWVINGTQNMAFVKPSKAGSQTNLNLITESGHVYSFTLREVGEKAQPDLKIFVESKDGALLASLKPRFVAREQVNDYAEQVKLAQAETARVRVEAQAEIDTAKKRQSTELAMAKAGLPQTLTFPYSYTNQKEFAVDAIYTDGKFTYIRANPLETPAVYELKDGKPSLIQFQFSNGLYTIPKLVDRGYMQIGKKNLHFSRKDQ